MLAQHDRFNTNNSGCNPCIANITANQQVLDFPSIYIIKLRETTPNYYHQIAVKLTQKNSSFGTADTNCVDFKTVVVKNLNRSQNNKNKTCSHDITNQTERSSLVKYSDDELTELIESGQLIFIVQKGRKIYLNNLD